MPFQKLDKRMPSVSCFLIVTLCSLLVFSFAACGRRGDPVPITPYDENVVQEDTDITTVLDSVPVEGAGADREDAELMPDPPSGLMGLYTQTAVVLTWDEGNGQEIKRYKVYRSTGEGYFFIGDTAAPAFTDHEVTPDTTYYYKVTAVGVLESGPSKEIVIVTEVH